MATKSERCWEVDFKFSVTGSAFIQGADRSDGKHILEKQIAAYLEKEFGALTDIKVIEITTA